MLKDFKEFIQRGNVLELAVGLIMGTYFGAIVKSLVDDIILPPLSLVMGGDHYQGLKVVLRPAREAVGTGSGVEEVAIYYGNFISVCLTFLIVAFAVFLLIRTYNRYLKKMEEEPTPAPANPTREVELLSEIRDALKKE